jgi:hypothetical protein
MRTYEESKQTSTSSKPGAFMVRYQNKNTQWKPKNYLNSYPNNSMNKNTFNRKYSCNVKFNKFNQTKQLPVVCHYCGKPHHTRPNCRKLARDKLNGVYKPQFNKQILLQMNF